MAETGLPDSPGNPRQEGYLLACEGILRSRFGRRPSSVVARTLEILRREEAEEAEEAAGARVQNAPRVSGVGAWLNRLLPWIQGRGRGPALAVGAIALGFTLMAVLLSPVRQSAPTEIGRLISVVGEPLLSGVHGRSLAPVISNAPVHLGDRLETGDADKAEIRFLDGTTLRLGFNTRVEIGKQKAESGNFRSGILRSPPPLLRPAEVHLVRGQVWTQVRKAAEDNPQSIPYAIRTEAATAIARGTEFGVRLQRTEDPPVSAPFAIRDSPLAAILTVKEGLVDFTNAHGSVRATAMTESTARTDAAPTEPRRLETLQVVQFDSHSTLSLLTSPLDWPAATERLVGGGGWAGVIAQDFSLALTNTTPRPTPTLLAGGNPGSELRIVRVLGGSPAAVAGLRLGDVLLALDDQPIASAGQLHREFLLRAGTATTLAVTRDDQPLTVTFTPLPQSSLLPGPSLTPAQSARLAGITAHWLRTLDATTTAAPSWDLGNAMSKEIRRLPALRAAAENNLGVILELEDAIGPAVRAYGRAVQADPNSALYRFNLGLALRAIGSFERAAEELAEAFRLAPDSRAIRHRLAEVQSLLGRDEEALALIDPLLSTESADHVGWELKSRLLSRLRRPAEAVEAAGHAVESGPDCPTAWSYLAGSRHRTGDLHGAEEAQRNALRLAPYEAVHQFGLGNILNDQGRLPEAEQAFRRALELQPDFILPHLNLGRVLADLRRLEEADAILRRAVEIAPDDAAIHRELGQVASRQRRFEDAEAHYRRALGLSPHDAAAHQGLAWTFPPRGNLAEAERLLRLACELAPDTAIYHNDLGEVLRRGGRSDEAAPLYRRAIELDPDDPSPRNNLAILQAVAGDYAAAEREFRALIDLATRHRRINPVQFIANLAIACERQGKLDEAEAAHRQALTLNPAHPELVNNLAWFLADHERHLDEALQLARRAVGVAPDNAGFLDTLGWVHFKRGDLDTAEQTLALALERAAASPDADEIRQRLRRVQERKGAAR